MAAQKGVVMIRVHEVVAFTFNGQRYVGRVTSTGRWSAIVNARLESGTFFEKMHMPFKDLAACDKSRLLPEVNP